MEQVDGADNLRPRASAEIPTSRSSFRFFHWASAPWCRRPLYMAIVKQHRRPISFDESGGKGALITSAISDVYVIGIFPPRLFFCKTVSHTVISTYQTNR